MSITAARFGSSPVLLDWNGIQSTVSAQVPELSAEKKTELFGHWQKLIGKLHDGTSGYYNAVQNAELSQVEACKTLAKKIIDAGKIKHCIFIGIGGSSLGPMCLLDSLKHIATSPIQFHFFENPDPIDWTYRIKRLSPSETMICVVTKSGTTYETISLFMIAYDWLKKGVGQNQAASQTVAITDPSKGELLEFAQKEKIQTLKIDSSVGGRYSVFTPVGLFPAALAGLNADHFLAGAKKVRDYCEKVTAEKNIFATWGNSLQCLYSTHRTHVMMPYTTPLKLLADWWVQLWAESLGKDGKGFTAIGCLGAIDQHSMLQLLRDGPNDKMLWFVNVQDFGTQVKVPSLDFKVKSFDLLQDQELGSILDTEFRSVQKVMTNRKRPHLQIQLDTLSEESIGSTFFILSMLTAYMGELIGVNPFDQPGVEEAKVYIRETLTAKKADAKNAAESSEDQVHRLRLHREN